MSKLVETGSLEENERKPELEGREQDEKVEVGESKRLYRSRKNKFIAGVAGGIGEYLGKDPTIVRIIFVILALLSGVGIIAYIAAWIIIPERPTGEEVPQPPETFSTEAGLIIGLILVGLGLWFLLTNLNLIPGQLFAILQIVRRTLWPITLIFIGVIIIIVASRGRELAISAKGRVLHRSRVNRRIAGVAGGLGEYFGVDPTLIRLAWVAFTIVSPAAGIITYIVAALVIPEESE